jgi:hypothetical protein
MSEPKGTLDTSVNGPEDPPGVFDGDAWQQVDWRMHEQRVRRLRRRIFKAVRDGDLAKARNLQAENPNRPRGLPGPYAWERARTVLKGPRRSNAPGLPG